MHMKQYAQNNSTAVCNTWWRPHPNFKLTIFENISGNYKETKFWVIKKIKEISLLMWFNPSFELIVKLYTSPER